MNEPRSAGKLLQNIHCNPTENLVKNEKKVIQIATKYERNRKYALL